MTKRTAIESLSFRKVLAVSPHSSAYDAACMMSKAHCGSVLIINGSGTLQGIFTERDLMERVIVKGLAPQTTMMSEVMTPDPQTIVPDTSVVDAVFLMKEYGFRHLPIVSSPNKILGVFSLRDALPEEIMDANYFVDHMDREFANVLA